MADAVLITTIAELRTRLDSIRAGGGRVGLVPTMGALHAGHGSLITRAASETDLVVATVFVNPLQFAPTEDLAAYPRDLQVDRALASSCGAAVVFAPSVEEMYPDRVLTEVRVAEVGGPLEGECRPGHFAGVATVVAKLFAIGGTCRAYFGEKDYQQLAVIRRMAADLSFPVEVVGCPTVREPNGLAMSSRNRYLSAPEREGASVLYEALRAGASAIEAGLRSAGEVRAIMRGLLDASPVIAALDYAEVVDGLTLQPVDPLAGELRLLVAARVGMARLIDNVGAKVATGA